MRVFIDVDSTFNSMLFNLSAKDLEIYNTIKGRKIVKKEFNKILKLRNEVIKRHLGVISLECDGLCKSMSKRAYKCLEQAKRLGLYSICCDMCHVLSVYLYSHNLPNAKMYNRLRIEYQQMDRVAQDSEILLAQSIGSQLKTSSIQNKMLPVPR